MEPPEEVTFQLLREMTDGFSEERKIGEGSFGVVYRGVTHAGEDVAVKVLKTNCDNTGSKQFQNEIHHLAMLRHQNIVQVLGYCYETEKESMVYKGKIVLTEVPHRAICLEYLPNKSLGDHLSDEFHGLDWDTRFKIIKGTCEGLKYCLHDLKEHLCHLDLKPDNILLDKDMLPKIADFGLSRIFGKELKRTTQDPLGTPGYQPPEYIDKGEVSDKFDIFSLGVMMIRIVSGPEGYPKCLDMSLDEFTNQVKKNWRHRLQATFNGSSLEMYCHQVKTCIQIALSCVEKDSQRRPDIVMFTDKLNEIEIDNCTLPWTGFRKTNSRTTRHNNMIEMRTEFKDIRGQPQSIKLMRGADCCEPEFVDAQETSSDVVEELIVGREKEKGEIMVSILEVKSEKIIILPIHGIGGIGKTTLARLIYSDPEFKCYSHVWVDVSQRFDLNKIRESIISQLNGEERHDNERLMTQNHLTNLFSDKKEILIVLDDLWEEDQFKLKDLMDMLYNKDSNIITLVTTRSKDVADKMCTNLQPHMISPLTDAMCWDIIKQRSGFEARDDKEQLEGIGVEIAKKCSGVALAAQSLGFTLRSMNINHWMEVKDSDIWNSRDHVLASLKLSYSYMDPCLKTCFTYCAMFPKGHKMIRDDLIYQWISLDFIKPTKLLSIMHLCEKHIRKLLGLSFFQHYSLAAKTTDEGYSKKETIFTMHDLVHDLAISLLGNKLLYKTEQEDTMGRSRHYQYALLEECSCSMTHWMTKATPLISLPLWLTSADELIALRFLDCRSTELHGAAFAPATSLRVLDLSECCIPELPYSIRELKELRYLNAPRVQDEMLPECITKLSHLIFLNLRESAIKEIPEYIGEMKGLMHLDLSGCEGIRQLPDSFMSLQNLVHLDFSGCSLWLGESESLGSLSRLEHLSLSGCTIEGDLAKALRGLTELQYLDLSQVFCVGKLCRGLEKVLIRSTKLRYLDVHGILDRSKVGMAVTENFIKVISRLSSLEYLNLGWNKRLYYIPDSIGNLSKLRTLDLSHCNYLERLPATISGIHNMKLLRVANCHSLDKSTLPSYKNVATILLPYFEVHADDSESSSNLCLLEYENPTKLVMSGLENVKSAAEAERIRLVEKEKIEKLGLVWTQDAKRFVTEDKDVLEKLVPPCTVEQIRLQGYNSTVFPSWMMDIATHLPRLVEVTLVDMPNFSSLPPLGQLPNLQELLIGRMDSIRKIGHDLYGGFQRGVFPRLQRFELEDMKCLEEWNTSCSYPSAGGEDGSNTEHAFPNLQDLVITHCPTLRVEFLSPLALLGRKMTIIRSCQVIPSSFECTAKFDQVTCSAAITWLCIEHCEAPLHQWSLLRHLPHLTALTINNCSDLTCSSTDLLRCLPSLKRLCFHECKSIAALPQRLGDLTSLEELYIKYCGGIKALPESIRQLTRLRLLEISGCPRLVQLGCPPSLETLSFETCYGSMAQLPPRLGDLTSLKNLHVGHCDVKALPESIQQLTCLQHLTIDSCPKLVQLGCPPCLETLSFEDCGSMAQLPQRLGDLTSLKNLYVGSCEGLKALPESIQQLTCLQHLKINFCPELVQLRCPASLLTLSIKNCISMTQLPQSLGDLSSLVSLEIIGCQGVKALPESIQQLTCLQSLKIYCCHQLVQWCESEENKMKLAHIKERIYSGGVPE